MVLTQVVWSEEKGKGKPSCFSQIRSRCRFDHRAAVATGSVRKNDEPHCFSGHRCVCFNRGACEPTILSELFLRNIIHCQSPHCSHKPVSSKNKYRRIADSRAGRLFFRTRPEPFMMLHRQSATPMSARYQHTVRWIIWEYSIKNIHNNNKSGQVLPSLLFCRCQCCPTDSTCTLNPASRGPRTQPLPQTTSNARLLMNVYPVR